jgi:hypothetical protein
VKFFLPYAENDQELAEKQYLYFKEAYAKDHSGSRIYSLKFIKEGREYIAQVGDFMMGGGKVLAIFSQPKEAFYRVLKLVRVKDDGDFECDIAMIGSPIKETTYFDE